MRTITILVAVLVAVVVGVAACGGDDGSDDAAATETAPAATDTAPAETTEQAEGDADAGADVFASAGCGGCHTLAAANASGTTGPNLDELQPDAETVAEQVTNGGGGMPAFEGELTEQQIQDVAAYVAENAGG